MLLSGIGIIGSLYTSLVLISPLLAFWQAVLFRPIITNLKPSFYVPAAAFVLIVHHIGFGVMVRWWLFAALSAATGFGMNVWFPANLISRR